MFGRFSEEAQKVLVLANKEMYDLNHSNVGTEHLLLAILKQNEDISSKLKKYKITYKSFKDEKSYNDGIIKLYEEIIDNLSYPLAGCIYTQLSDVEDETNGFLTYDRKVLKINEEKIKKLNERIYEVFYHE